MYRFRTALFVAALLVSIPGSAVAQEDRAEGVAVTADSPPAVRVAFHDLERARLPRDTVEAYRDLIDGLSRRCQYSGEQVARVATAASDMIAKYGAEGRSAYQILELFDQSATSGPYSSTVQCGQVFPSILANLMGESGISEAKIRNALDAMGGLLGSGG